MGELRCQSVRTQYPMRHTVTYLAAGLAFGVSCKASSTTVFMIPANAAVGSPQLDSAPVAVS